MSFNFWAVLVSAIASMAVGSIWYGPLFGKQFMHAMGMHEWSAEKQQAMKKKMGWTYLWQFIASILMFSVLAVLITATHSVGSSGGFKIAFWAWLGFVVPLKLGESLWGGKASLFWLGTGNMLITLLLAGIILGGWR